MTSKAKYFWPNCVAKHRLGSINIIVPLILVLGAFTLRCSAESLGDSEEGRLISFETIAERRESLPKLGFPSIFLAFFKGGEDSFSGLLRADDAERVSQVDYSNEFVVAVFRGIVGGTLSSISVKEVRASPGNIKFVVQLTDPAPGTEIPTVSSNPYHIIRMKDDDISTLLDEDICTRWVMETLDGFILAVTTYPSIATGVECDDPM